MPEEQQPQQIKPTLIWPYIAGATLLIGAMVGITDLRKNTQDDNDRSEKVVEIATARTLQVEGNTREIALGKEGQALISTNLGDLIADMALLKAFRLESLGRLDRAESALVKNTLSQEAQLIRATVRAGERTVKNGIISENSRNIAKVIGEVNRRKSAELLEYRASTKRLQKELNEKALEIQRLEATVAHEEVTHKK